MSLEHDKLIHLIHARIQYVRIVAWFKFIQNQPIYVPAVEKEQSSAVMKVADQLLLDSSIVEQLMRVVRKLSRQIQRDLHAIWVETVPFCDPRLCEEVLQRLHHLRLLIRDIDIQILQLLSRVTEQFSPHLQSYVDGYRTAYNAPLLYKLYVLINQLISNSRDMSKKLDGNAETISLRSTCH